MNCFTCHGSTGTDRPMRRFVSGSTRDGARCVRVSTVSVPSPFYPCGLTYPDGAQSMGGLILSILLPSNDKTRSTAASSVSNRRLRLADTSLSLEAFPHAEVKLYRTDAMPEGKAPPPSSEPVVLRVLPSMNVRTFYLKVIKSLKVPKAAQPSVRLWLRMPDDRLAAIDRDDTRDLDWWGVEDGVEMFTFIES